MKGDAPTAAQGLQILKGLPAFARHRAPKCQNKPNHGYIRAEAGVEPDILLAGSNRALIKGRFELVTMLFMVICPRFLAQPLLEDM